MDNKTVERVMVGTFLGSPVLAWLLWSAYPLIATAATFLLFIIGASAG